VGGRPRPTIRFNGMLAGLENVCEIPRHVCYAILRRASIHRLSRGDRGLCSAIKFPKSLSSY